MSKYTGEIMGNMFYFENNDISDKELDGHVSYGQGGKGNDWMGIELTPRQKVSLTEGNAVLKVINKDNVCVDFQIENVI